MSSIFQEFSSSQPSYSSTNNSHMLRSVGRRETLIHNFKKLIVVSILQASQERVFDVSFNTEDDDEDNSNWRWNGSNR